MKRHFSPIHAASSVVVVEKVEDFFVKKGYYNVSIRYSLIPIKEKRYFEKYLNENKDIYLIGITFDEEERNIKEFKWERI